VSYAPNEDPERLRVLGLSLWHRLRTPAPT